MLETRDVDGETQKYSQEQVESNGHTFLSSCIDFADGFSVQVAELVSPFFIIYSIHLFCAVANTHMVGSTSRAHQRYISYLYEQLFIPVKSSQRYRAVKRIMRL